MSIGFPTAAQRDQRSGAFRQASIDQRTDPSSFSRTQSSSSSGERFEPFQQAGREEALTFALQQLPGAFNNDGPGSFEDNLAIVGGANTPFTNIPQNGVLTPQQIQQRVNATTAQGNMTAAGNLRRLQDRFGGRGFGSNSPLMAELQAQIQGQALAGNTSAELNFREQAARDNAENMLQSGIAQTGVEQSRSADDIARRQLALNFEQNFWDRQFNREGGLLSAITAMTDPLQFAESQESSISASGEQRNVQGLMQMAGRGYF